MNTCTNDLNHLKNHLLREIEDEDLQKLTQIPMIRITRFDSDKADDFIAKLEDEMKEVQHHLDNLIDFAIDYFAQIKREIRKRSRTSNRIKKF